MCSLGVEGASGDGIVLASESPALSCAALGRCLVGNSSRASFSVRPLLLENCAGGDVSGCALYVSSDALAVRSRVRQGGGPVPAYKVR